MVELTDADEIEIEIDAKYAPDGSVLMIPVDESNRPLGVYTVDGQVIQLNETQSDSAWKDVAVWLIIILAGVGVALYLVFRTVYMIFVTVK